MSEDFITNFVRTIPKQGQEKWMAKLNKMKMLFYEAEYQTVKRGFRPAGIVHLGNDNYKELLKLTNKDNLVITPFLKGGYFCQPQYLPREYASYKSIRPGEPFFWYGSLTRTYEDGQKFKKAENEGDHKTMGSLLGYPECCIKHFIEILPINYDLKTFPINDDPIWLGKEGKVTGYPECNQMLLCFGARITAHFSCSPTCEATKKIGQSWFKVMKEIDKNLAKELYDLLVAKLIWNNHRGIIRIETPYFIGLTNAFSFMKKPRVIEWRGIKK